MFKPNFKEFPRGELIKENETITLFSIYDFKGGAFSISTIQVILGNEKRYRGFYRYGKNEDWVIGQHEPILN